MFKFFFFRNVLLIELSNFTLMINFDSEKHTEKKTKVLYVFGTHFEYFNSKVSTSLPVKIYESKKKGWLLYTARGRKERKRNEVFSN